MNRFLNQSPNLRASIQSIETRTNDLNQRIESLEEQLRVKNSQLDIIDSRMEERVRSLEEQLKVKDSQLESKDSQLEKQAVHIQTLIQENSKLNFKMLSEAQETRKVKPWWRFW